MQNILKVVMYPVMVILLVIPFRELNAQTFGFGCLGLSGFYGGYSIQRFEAGGLNESLISYYNNLGITDPEICFGEVKGLRFGANIFRAKFDNYFITLKGYYQFLKEEHSRVEQIPSGNYEDKHILQLNHWGVGVDIGIPLLEFMDLKLVEGGVLFYSAEFTIESKLNNQSLPEIKYDRSDFEMGYYVATGVILHIIPDYISLEGSAIYNFIQIGALEDLNGNAIPYSSINKNFIESGKIAAAVQLNIGFPL